VLSFLNSPPVASLPLFAPALVPPPDQKVPPTFSLKRLPSAVLVPGTVPRDSSHSPCPFSRGSELLIQVDPPSCTFFHFFRVFPFRFRCIFCPRVGGRSKHPHPLILFYPPGLFVSVFFFVHPPFPFDTFRDLRPDLLRCPGKPFSKLIRAVRIFHPRPPLLPSSCAAPPPF